LSHQFPARYREGGGNYRWRKAVVRLTATGNPVRSGKWFIFENVQVEKRPKAKATKAGR
jgi:hypothetical protein